MFESKLSAGYGKLDDGGRWQPTTSVSPRDWIKSVIEIIFFGQHINVGLEPLWVYPRTTSHTCRNGSINQKRASCHKHLPSIRKMRWCMLYQWALNYKRCWWGNRNNENSTHFTSMTSASNTWAVVVHWLLACANKHWQVSPKEMPARSSSRRMVNEINNGVGECNTRSSSNGIFMQNAPTLNVPIDTSTISSFRGYVCKQAK